MNITEEAIKAAAEAIDFNHDWTYEGGVIYCMDCGLRVEGFVPRKYASQHSAVQRHQAQLALEAAEPYLRRKWAEELERAMFKVESVHHFGFGEGGIKCLCGFESARNRSRTEHITQAVRDLVEGGGNA